LRDFKKGDPLRRNGVRIHEGKETKFSKPVVLTAHVFYQDQVEFFVNTMNKLPAKSLVLITTPDPQIKQFFDSRLDKGRLEVEVRICQNRGRNFGPLLVEFGKRLSGVESFIHVHSKVSSHATDLDSGEWVNRLTGLFLDDKRLGRTRAIFDYDPQVGIAYSDVSDMFKGISFRWGLSKFALVPLLKRFGGFPRIGFRGAVDFPAGGMFWVKSDAIRPLLEANWSYEDFPPELGQLEGTVQHGVERLVGSLSSSLGYQHLVYRFHDDVFELRSPMS
jgi:lipopolysaccharide biosynthesis protein